MRNINVVMEVVLFRPIARHIVTPDLNMAVVQLVSLSKLAQRIWHLCKEMGRVGYGVQEHVSSDDDAISVHAYTIDVPDVRLQVKVVAASEARIRIMFAALTHSLPLIGLMNVSVDTI